MPEQQHTVSAFRFPALLAVLCAMAMLVACSGDPGTGPIEVKWDRDVCKRCNMVLSDRKHSAQIRYSPAGQRSQVSLFDDIGCAVLWLDQQPWKDEPVIEIWVNDHVTGEWIDARTAHYVAGQITPMEYGLGAQPEPTADSLTFTQAKAHIVQIERRFNAHGSHLKQAAEARKLPPIAPPKDQ